jgi:hypothetical protein
LRAAERLTCAGGDRLTSGATAFDSTLALTNSD